MPIGFTIYQHAVIKVIMGKFELECWNVGMLEYWNNGFWSNGMMSLKKRGIKTHKIVLIFL
jgi:hypothetical protein